jgi:hypothetical protein
MNDINKNPIVFLRIAWMEHYNGVSEEDKPKGAGSYVKENGKGGEVYNFTKKRGEYYGFARIQKNRDIDLSKLGGSNEVGFIEGVTVVFFAKNPIIGGQWIVGWYRNATLYRHIIDCPKKSESDIGKCLAHCKVKDGVLLKMQDRNWEIDGAGQTNLWYPEKHLETNQLKELKNYINSGGHSLMPGSGKKTGSSGWMKDAQLRKEIEIAAMDKVVDYYGNKGFECRYVHKENKGWDIEITKGTRHFYVEVKGTMNNFQTVELTPNEFNMLKHHKGKYIVCVVAHALEKDKQVLHVFTWDGNKWLNEKNQVLKIVEIKSARLSLQ